MPAGYSVQSMYRCLQTMYHVYSHVQLCTDVTIWEGRVGAKCYQFGARCHQYNLAAASTCEQLQATDSLEKSCFSRISDDTLGSFLAWF